MSEATTKSSTTAKDSTAGSSGSDGAKAKKTSDDGAKSEKSSDEGAKAKKSGDGAPAATPSASKGASDVYYGKFSNVKNPAYRGGWDDIWGNGNSIQNAPKKKKSARKKPAPVTLNLDFADMPKNLRTGLAKYARDELKRQKSRLNYDKHDKAGSVGWRIECRIEP